MDKELQAFVRYLKKYLPDPRGKPVYVKTRRRVTVLGSLMYDDKSSRIMVAHGQEHNTAVDTLCHEWAHMLDGGGWEDNRKEEHRQSWGRQYAKVYRAYWDFKNQWDRNHASVHP